MVKKENSAENETKAPKRSALKRWTVRLALVAVIGGASYGIWKNPQVLQQVKNAFRKEDVYQQQIEKINWRLERLQKQLAEVEAQIEKPDLSGFEFSIKTVEDKVAAIEVMNMNVIRSKADIATVLGVVTRMDKAEQKLDKILAVDDDSALILTGAMLVKDSAERGGSFEYEAEVLSNIAANNLKLQKQVAKIQKFARKGIVSELKLAQEFADIYAEIIQKQEKDFAKNWKERLNNKIGEIVQIKKTNAEQPEFAADNSLIEAQKLVADGQMMRAVRLLEQSQNTELLQNENLQNWVEKVKNRNDFYDVIRQISATSLAVMKVNFLKKKGN